MSEMSAKYPLPVIFFYILRYRLHKIYKNAILLRKVV